MSHRTDQVASVIKRAVQKVLTEGLSDPRLAPIMAAVLPPMILLSPLSWIPSPMKTHGGFSNVLSI